VYKRYENIFKTKEFVGDIRGYHWFDLWWRCQSQVKITLNFLNGTS